MLEHEIRSSSTARKSLILLAKWHSLPADEIKLQHEFGFDHWSSLTVLNAAKVLGLNARQFFCSYDELITKPLPAIGKDHQGHYFVLTKLNNASLINPESEQQQGLASKDHHGVLLMTDASLEHSVVIRYSDSDTQSLSVSDFKQMWSGELILMTPIADTDREKVEPPVLRFMFLKYWPHFVEVLICSMCIQILWLTPSLYFQVLIDKVFFNHTSQTLLMLTIGLIGAILFVQTLVAIRQHVLSDIGTKASVLLGSKLYSWILSTQASDFDNEKISKSLIKIKELERIRTFLCEKMLPACFDQLCMFLLIIMMLFYDLVLTAIVLLTLLSCFAILSIFTPVYKHRLVKMTGKDVESQSTLTQTLFNIDSVNALTIQHRLRQRWDKLIVDNLRTKLSLGQEKSSVSLLCATILKVAWVGVLWLAGEKVIASELSTGAFVAFAILISQVFYKSFQFIDVWFNSVQFFQSLKAIEDMDKEAAKKVKSRFALQNIEGLIEFEDITYRYRPDSSDVLKNFHLTISPGEIVGIIGQSGAGKSTLSKLLRRQAEPVKGKVMIDGYDIQTVDLLTLNSQVGLVGALDQLLIGTIRDNITIANPKLTTEEVVSISILAGAHPFICNLPEGYDTQIHRGGVNLSAGERGLIALARVLAANNKILILDGFLDNLGPIQVENIQSILCKLALDRTVLILTQRPSILKHATKIVVLEKGQIVESGAPNTLLELKNSVYKKMLTAELKNITSLDTNADLDYALAESTS